MSAVDEKLSVIVPCFNEEASVGALLERLLAKRLAIPKEVVVVESHSSDRTRAIVEGFRDRTDVTLVFEDRPRGKGHAVRAGLAAATGTILLIQDADLEYDVDDYDALLEPILSRRATFVLGSRSLGPRGWRVRSLPESPFTEVTLNLAQVAFARTFNLLYGQRTTDINTMFKVFRAECLDGISFACDRFAFDMELVCKLTRRGHSPVEVPVRYAARGFSDGKKWSFQKDAFPSYWAIIKHRFEE